MDFAVVGAGVIGKLRAQTVMKRADCRLVAVCDPVEQAARAAAGKSGAKVFADHRTMLDAVKPAAVICASPAHLHESVAIDALNAGCHLLCEKPLAPTSAGSKRIVAAAAKAGREIGVGFNLRYFAAFKYLRRCLDDGVVGRVDHFRSFGGHDGLNNFRADWMYKSELSGGGAMMDVGIHMTDLCRFAAGEIVRVQAKTTGSMWKVPGSEDDAMAIFETAAGPPIIYQATWSEWTGYKSCLEVYGEKGMVRAYYAPMTTVTVLQDKPGAARRKTCDRHLGTILREKFFGWQTTAQIAFEEELADFVARIGGKKVPLASGHDGVRAVEIAEACYLSSREGRAVVPGEG